MTLKIRQDMISMARRTLGSGRLRGSHAGCRVEWTRTRAQGGGHWKRDGGMPAFRTLLGLPASPAAHRGDH
jgi:hypothetical protein